MLDDLHLKYDEGGTMDMIQILIGILALTMILIVNISLTSTADKRSRVELVAHEYILRMETSGFLESKDKANLKKTLEDMGMTDVFIDATSREVQYGNVISLSISGNLAIKQFNMDTSGFSLIGRNSTIPVKIKKTSVSRKAW